jgi:hypothetical protein
VVDDIRGLVDIVCVNAARPGTAPAVECGARTRTRTFAGRRALHREGAGRRVG